MGGIDKGFRAILDIGWANPKAVEDKSYANPIKGKGIFSTFFFLLRRGANAAQLTCLSIHVLFVFLSARVWMISPTIWGQWTHACMHYCVVILSYYPACTRVKLWTACDRMGLDRLGLGMWPDESFPIITGQWSSASALQIFHMGPTTHGANSECIWKCLLFARISQNKSFISI